jgi:hypothetical protein
MSDRRVRPRWALILGLATVASFVFVACGEDGEAPSCPELTLYDISKAGERNSPEVAEERANAVDAGCMTPLLVDSGMP